MRGSTYAPQKLSEFEAQKLNFVGIGVKKTCTHGSVTTMDLFVNDDHLVSGGRVVVSGATYGDHFDMQVVDIDNVMGYGAGVVLKSFISNWYVPDGNSSFALEVPYPAKIYGGLYIRILYTSVGMLDSDIAINYLLHKVLV